MITSKEYYSNKVFFNVWLLEQAKEKGAKYWKNTKYAKYYLFSYKPYGLVVYNDLKSIEIMTMRCNYDPEEEWLSDYDVFLKFCKLLKIEI
jgi:hypothetical protein